MKVFGCVSYLNIDYTTRTKFDAKSRKCFFIGYGDSELSYRSWDDRNQKIIRSKDVLFNEDVLYKDRGKDSEAKKFEVILTTTAVALKRSSRTIKLPHRYSLALHYILLTNRGKLESYDEATQDKESVKWELAMKDEMDFLMSNQMW